MHGHKHVPKDQQSSIIITNIWLAFQIRRIGVIRYMILSTESIYRKTSHISRTLVGNKIVDNSDVVGASPVGAAPTTSSLST